ncbi:MAG: hypothetical protein V2J62_06705 [candidate division KSB1 bacterium]|nr:hypothetical protein [candidate division KSB1 bacterium]
MNKTQLIIGIISLLIAIMIIIFGNGLRVIYSSALFIFLGVLMIFRAARGKEKD